MPEGVESEATWFARKGGSRTVTQREKADLWRARAAEPEIAAIIERAKRTFRGTYHDVMV